MLQRKTTLQEPTWINLTNRRPAGLSDHFYDWLVNKGSLTQQVIAACFMAFRVRLLRQGWGRPQQSEARLLKMSRGEAALVREVELCCGEQPWVFARTLIPASSLNGRARQLAYLREKPLGALLFADPTTKRDSVQIARILPRHPLFVSATDHLTKPPNEVWGRRTLFRYAGKPLLVNEIFLPDIPIR